MLDRRKIQLFDELLAELYDRVSHVAYVDQKIIEDEYEYACLLRRMDWNYEEISEELNDILDDENADNADEFIEKTIKRVKKRFGDR